MHIFTDRKDAGKELASKLASYRNNENAIILALPRGGVPVAYEVAKALNILLDVLIVRKLGVLFHKELAMGALAFDKSVVIDHNLVNRFKIIEDLINEVVNKETKELDRRNKLYRKERKFPHLTDKIIILIDDGAATGLTMLASIKALKKHNPEKIIIAVSIGPESVYNELTRQADEVIFCNVLDGFYAVGQAYKDSSQTSDKEVNTLLSECL